MTEIAEPVGRKLAKAREARGLALEEAAIETRIRASQLAALEADDYSAFPNNTYARGFLLIYGRFLGVDVREVARNLEGGNPINVDAYQYLTAFPEAEPQRDAPRRREPEPRSRRPSLAPLIVFVLLLGAGALGVHLYLQAQRLETTPAPSTTTNVESVTPGTAASAPVATTSIIPPSAVIVPKTTPQPFAGDRAFVAPTPAPAPAPVTQPLPTPTPLPPVNELTVEPLKKTHITIRRDDPNAEPIFDDVLYPKVGSLKLKGARFFLEIREPDAVALRKNGQVVAYQPPGVTIQ